jgi:hypothetical protein
VWLNCDQVHVVGRQASKLSKESTDFVTFGLFTIVERLREILGKDRKSIVMLDGIVRNQVMYEWFTVRAGRLSGISVFL